MSSPIEIKSFNVKEASQAEYAALNRHLNIIRQERLPDDPPITLDERIQELKNIPPYVDVKIWYAREAGHDDMIAEGLLQLINMEENQHLAQFEITVQPKYRLQGLGRQMLSLITRAAEADNRRLLITTTYDTIPAGAAFMTRLSAKRGLEGHVNQLRLEDLDRNLLAQWMEQGHSLASEFELGLWDGPYPDDRLEAVVQLFELNNQQPFGDIEVEDVHMTPERLRQMEQMIFSRGDKRWTFYIIEKGTGNFAGYTETTWNPNRPEILHQDMTGVFPTYRNKGLGRWLKAAMLDKVLRDRTDVKFVRTGNADINAAMLKINTELGFQPYLANALWQIEIERILSYLEQDRQGGNHA